MITIRIIDRQMNRIEDVVRFSSDSDALMCLEYLGNLYSSLNYIWKVEVML